MKKNHLIELLKIVTWPKKIIVFSVIFSIFSSLIALFLPILTKRIVDDFSADNFKWEWLVFLVGFIIINSVLSGISFYMLKYMGSNAIYHIRKKMFKHILKLPTTYFDNNDSGTTMSRLTDDIENMNDFISSKIPNLLSQLILIIGSIVMLFVLDWKLTLAMMSVIPITLFVILPIGNLTYSISQKTQNEMADFTGLLSRVLTEIRLVKSYGAEGFEFNNGENKLSNLFKLHLKEAKIQAIVSPVVTFSIMFVLLLIIGYGGLRVSNGSISAGTYVAIIFYLIQSVTPIASLSSFYTDYKKTSGSTERLYEIYTMPTEDFSTQSNNHIVQNGSIEARNLNFTYDGVNNVLRNLNFVVPPNKTTAIVGPSGSGKSTLFYLIERMYQPNNGEILYNGIPIHDYDLRNWRSMIGYVMQESPMMNGTIRENLLYGVDKPVDDETLMYNAKLANAHDFIIKFPNQYDTLVGERGVKVSGGQKQRLAIGRAFMRNPNLLLLDEATSSLDSESEKLVQEALEALMSNRTTIVIAHRLSTIKNADQIIFLDNGEITGTGKHEELYQSHQRYALFVDTQAFDKKVTI